MVSSRPINETEILEGKIFAVLAYLSVLCVIPLVFKKNNQFVLLHGKQGLVIFVAQVALFILHIVFPGILRFGFFILGVLSFCGLIAVLRGKYVRLPLIAEISEKIEL